MGETSISPLATANVTLMAVEPRNSEVCPSAWDTAGTQEIFVEQMKSLDQQNFLNNFNSVSSL